MRRWHVQNQLLTLIVTCQLHRAGLGVVWGSLGRLRLRVGNLGRGGPAQGLSDGARGCAMKLLSVRYEPSKMYYSIHGTGTATRQQNKNERNCCKRCRGRMGQLA